MKFDDLKQRVLKTNLALADAGLVVLTWGNASGSDRGLGVIAIKPSGVSYNELTADKIVVLSIDTPTHLHLYREFPCVNGVVHTHSPNATAFAQAKRPISCFGTTHADNFYGDIPVTRELRFEEVEANYELNTGRVIIERFRDAQLDPEHVPGVLVASHAPFAWGSSPEKAVENAIVLEFAAQMAMAGLSLASDIKPIPAYLLDKHFLRKHGPKAYYGQPKS
jgi:L-ribulose-5-phosphate 4-epimerase